MARKKNLNFENALEELESLVEDMESGELSLEASLTAFEKGIKLTRECQEALNQAEQKIQILMKKNDQANNKKAVAAKNAKDDAEDEDNETWESFDPDDD